MHGDQQGGSTRALETSNVWEMQGLHHTAEPAVGSESGVRKNEKKTLHHQASEKNFMTGTVGSAT